MENIETIEKIGNIGTIGAIESVGSIGSDYSQLLIILFFGLIGLILLITLLYYALVVLGRHKGIMKRDLKICEKYSYLPPNFIALYNTLVTRRLSHIQNYFIFQITNKVFGVTGIIFSIYGLICSLLDAPKNLALGVSMVSIISVIVALYLSPTKRVTEYINAWRICDNAVNEAIKQMPMYNRILPDDPPPAGENPPEAPAAMGDENWLDKVCGILKEVEDSLTSDSE